MSDGTVVRAPNEWICVVQGGRLRHIPDLPTFDNLGFVPGDINQITNDQFGSIKQGDPIPHLDSRLLRGPDQKIYLMVHGSRRYVPDPATLEQLAVKQGPRDVSAQLLTELPEGPSLPAITSRLVRAPDGRVYLIINGMFRYIPDPETLKHICVQGGATGVSSDFMATLPTGPPLPQGTNACGS